MQAFTLSSVHRSPPTLCSPRPPTMALRVSATRLGRSLATAPQRRTMAAAATLPDLPFDYGALQPVISGEIMELHHKKHHQAYVTNLNKALEQSQEASNKNDLGGQIALQSAIKFNGGGHLNHSIFWKNLISPKDFVPPSAELKADLEAAFGSVESFISQFNAAAAGVQGSGWGWLGYNKSVQKLVIATTANQDPLQPTTGIVPLLGIDVWEHAYYLQYKNVRPDYLKEVWKVVNWKDVAERYAAARR
ncbi:Iron/manganese superoxide dismutase [Helicosporidium sp. ATCC 50920]|nr:Iron/manganese superoxide dismutase [Helicosporidium sp. ATCC 50920]|eukprot:KDD73082.1 Iron/manganese superoxide dismutase [Helicosporidium sp. ATCC 50920]